MIEYTYRQFEPAGRMRTMATKKATQTKQADQTTDQTTAQTAEETTVNTANTGAEAVKAQPESTTDEMQQDAVSTDKMDKKTPAKTADHSQESPVQDSAVQQEKSNLDKLSQIMVELRKPFHPTQVTWKPGALAKTGNKALALAYADLRAYQNRLDELCGANWAVSYTPWGDRIVCNLTIYGVTRSSTGEADSQSERSEIAGTASEAQAFKRACAMFGLGRYLYNLPSVWAEYDADRKQFTEPAKAKLLSILVQHYRRSHEGKNGSEEVFEAEDHSPNGSPNGGVPESLVREFETMGRELYGEQWEQVRRRNAQRISGGQAKETGELTGEQIQKLVDGMKKLMNQRAVA